MRFLLASAGKSFKENLRDWKVLSMVLLFAPFFLLLTYLLYGSGPTTYSIGIINQDGGSSATELVNLIGETESQDGAPLFRIYPLKDNQALQDQVKSKALDIGMVIPEGYTRALADKGNDSGTPDLSSPCSGTLSFNTLSSTGKKTLTKPDVSIQFFGSMSNPRYAVAAVMVGDAIHRQGLDAAGVMLPASITETFLEKKQLLNDFDAYVPGLITLSILMILFTATASIVKESDKKTLIRLKLSRLSSFHFLAGISVVQTLIGAGALALSYWTALGLGYRPAGGLGPVLIVGILSALSIIAISLIVASFLNTVYDVLTIGCFPFFLLMFFSGSMFPLPKLSLFTIAGHPLGPTDLLPLTHTVNAYNQILNNGAGWSTIGFDVFMIVLLTLIYGLIGLALYQKRRLSRA